MLCWSPPYDDWNPSHIYIHIHISLPPEPASHSRHHSLPPHHSSWSESAKLGSLCYRAASRQLSVFTGVVFPDFMLAGLPWGAIFIPSTGSLAGPSDLKTRDLQLWETHLCHLSNNFLLSTSSLLELLLIRGWTSWIDFLNFLFFPPTVQFIVCVLFFLKGLILYSDSSGLFFSILILKFILTSGIIFLFQRHSYLLLPFWGYLWKLLIFTVFLSYTLSAASDSFQSSFYSGLCQLHWTISANVW